MGKVCLAWAENVLFADLGQLRCEIMDSYQITSAHDMHRIIEALRGGFPAVQCGMDTNGEVAGT